MNRLLSPIAIAAFGLALWGLSVEVWARESRAVQKDGTGVEEESASAKRMVVYWGTSPEGTAKLLRESRTQEARELGENPDAREWLTAVAVEYKAPIYASPSRHYPISHVRGGSHVRVSEPIKGSECHKGDWHMISGGGYICSGAEFDLVTPGEDTGKDRRPPRDDQPMPYEYLKVIDQTAYSFRTPPSADALRELHESDKKPPETHSHLEGIVFFALDKKVEHDGNVFFRLINGNYVEKAAVERVTPSQLHGHRLQNANDLPMAFVYREEVPVYEDAGHRELRQIGIAEKYARFAVDRNNRTLGDKEFVVTKDGHLVHKDDVRIVDVVAPPREVPKDAKWISVRISQQTLTAYEGDRPVFATLVSTGIKGKDTPLGLDRLTNKCISTTMRGTQAQGKSYNIAQVPWAMYHRKLYAIHGAYWHDVFGTRRSSGCTNMSPSDAFWLFHWADPKIRDGWHCIRFEGTHVHFAP